MSVATNHFECKQWWEEAIFIHNLNPHYSTFLYYYHINEKTYSSSMHVFWTV